MPGLTVYSTVKPENQRPIQCDDFFKIYLYISEK